MGTSGYGVWVSFGYLEETGCGRPWGWQDARVTIETTPAHTVAYGDDPAQVYDVLAPTAEQVAGLAAAGYHVAVGEYRRWSATGPGWWRETLADIEALLRAVAADPGLPDRLVVMGHSAGGHLAAWAAGAAGRAGPAGQRRR